MTREEEIKQKALKLYPIKEQKNKKGTGIYDANLQRRKAFEDGAKWVDTHPFQSEEEQVGMGELGMMWQKQALINKAEENTALSSQVGGSHYKDLVIQPIEFIHANNIPFCEANAIKYLCRWRIKNGIQDLEKAKHYIDLLIELEKRNDRGTV